MAPFVVDASMTLCWCFADEATEYTRAVLASLENSYAVVPALWPFEVANALSSAERRQRITEQGIADFLEKLRLLPIQIERREAAWLWQQIIPLARQHHLTVYDATYLELAKREGMNLATVDDDLRSAGQAIGVAVV